LPEPITPKRRRSAELGLFALACIWGSTFVVIKGVLRDISPLGFIAARFLVAAPVIFLIYRKKLNRAALWPGVLTGVLLFLGFVLQTEGLALTTPSKSAFLTGLSVAMVPFANSLVYGTRPRKFEVIGVVVASLGMALMTLPSGKFEMTTGDFLSLLCAIAFAFHFVVNGHYSSTLGFETIAVMQIGTAAVLGSLSALLTHSVQFRPSPGLAVAVVATGLLATALAFTTMAWAQQFTTPVRAALILALEPAVAWCAAWVVMGEVLTGRGKIGAGLILAGVLLVELKHSKPETNL